MKGQRFRIYDPNGDQVIQGETSCELHISIETESEQNKDNADNADYPTMVGYSFDVTIECQISSFIKHGEMVKRSTDFDAGDNHTLELAQLDSAGQYQSKIASGSFITTSVSYKSDNKKTITATIKLEGSGELTLE